MAATPWPTASPPTGLVEVWRQQLTRVADLPRVRAHIRTLLTTGHAATPPPSEWVERFVLVSDEIASNALRHGSGPVHIRLCADSDSWLIAVTDRASDAPPVPATGRAPGAGGYGLHLIADLTDDHGWHREDHHKTVWARAGPIHGGPRSSSPG
jgi:anti-sigma regulatory factor (Ser/Thr protein kinase)